MDLSAQLTHNVLVERQRYTFFFNIEYENIPKYCPHCNMIGHSLELEACKRLNAKLVEKGPKENTKKVFVKVRGANKNIEKEKEKIRENDDIEDVGNKGKVTSSQPETSGVQKFHTLQNKIEALLEVDVEPDDYNIEVADVLEESDDSSIGNEFVDVTRLIDEEVDTIENSPIPSTMGNKKFL
ncbi:unnamed protein product [Lathyrus sativus]|nr:unnamed protein product [Lathyrus sativus]